MNKAAINVCVQILCGQKCSSNFFGYIPKSVNAGSLSKNLLTLICDHFKWAHNATCQFYSVSLDHSLSHLPGWFPVVSPILSFLNFPPSSSLCSSTCFLFQWKKGSNQKWISTRPSNTSLCPLHLGSNILLFLFLTVKALEKDNSFYYHYISSTGPSQ